MTASIQGHNINVFQIKHGLLESSSESDADLSYVHLYRLQRGLTNAVRTVYLFIFSLFNMFFSTLKITIAIF